MQCRPQGAPSGPRLFLQLCSDWPLSGLSDFTEGEGRNFLAHPKSQHPLPGNSPPRPRTLPGTANANNSKGGAAASW